MPTTSATVVPMSEERPTLDELQARLMALEKRLERKERKKRDAAIAMARASEEYLGLEPKEQALCPNCQRVWNKRA